MWARGNTERPGSAYVVVNCFERQVVVEHFNTPVGAVRDVDVPFRIGGDRVREVQLTLARTFGADGGDEYAVLAVLDDAGVAVAVGYEDVPGGVPSHVGRPVEEVLLRGR